LHFIRNTEKAISKTPSAGIPAKAGIQYSQEFLDCPIKPAGRFAGPASGGILPKDSGYPNIGHKQAGVTKHVTIRNEP